MTASTAELDLDTCSNSLEPPQSHKACQSPDSVMSVDITTSTAGSSTTDKQEESFPYSSQTACTVDSQNEKFHEKLNEHSNENSNVNNNSSNNDETKQTPKTRSNMKRSLSFADDWGSPLQKVHVFHTDQTRRVVILMLSPSERTFEFLHLEVPLDAETTVGDLLGQIGMLASNPVFQHKHFVSLSNPKTSEILDNETLLRDKSGEWGDFWLGVMEGNEINEIRAFAMPLLLNQKIIKTVYKAKRKGKGLKAVLDATEWKQHQERQQRFKAKEQQQAPLSPPRSPKKQHPWTSDLPSPRSPPADTDLTTFGMDFEDEPPESKLACIPFLDIQPEPPTIGSETSTDSTLDSTTLLATNDEEEAKNATKADVTAPDSKPVAPTSLSVEDGNAVTNEQEKDTVEVNEEASPEKDAVKADNMVERNAGQDGSTTSLHSDTGDDSQVESSELVQQQQQQELIENPSTSSPDNTTEDAETVQNGNESSQHSEQDKVVPLSESSPQTDVPVVESDDAEMVARGQDSGYSNPDDASPVDESSPDKDETELQEQPPPVEVEDEDIPSTTKESSHVEKAAEEVTKEPEMKVETKALPLAATADETTSTTSTKDDEGYDDEVSIDESVSLLVDALDLAIPQVLSWSEEDQCGIIAPKSCKSILVSSATLEDKDTALPLVLARGTFGVPSSKDTEYVWLLSTFAAVLAYVAFVAWS